MATVTINYTQLVEQSKDVDLPVYISYAGSFYKIVSADNFIQVEPENITGNLTVKKWNNSITVARILSDSRYVVCAESDFTTAYQNALNAIANYVSQ